MLKARRITVGDEHIRVPWERAAANKSALPCREDERWEGDPSCQSEQVKEVSCPFLISSSFSIRHESATMPSWASCCYVWHCRLSLDLQSQTLPRECRVRSCCICPFWLKSGDSWCALWRNRSLPWVGGCNDSLPHINLLCCIDLQHLKSVWLLAISTRQNNVKLCVDTVQRQAMRHNAGIFRLRLKIMSHVECTLDFSGCLQMKFMLWYALPWRQGR